jgi:hypothetical protein
MAFTHSFSDIQHTLALDLLITEVFLGWLFPTPGARDSRIIYQHDFQRRQAQSTIFHSYINGPYINTILSPNIDTKD